MDSYALISHEQLKADPYNVRRTFRPGLIEDLANSIAEHGLLQNLVVRPSTSEDVFWLVGGERRWRAIGELIKEGRWPRNDDGELAPIPCLVIAGDGKFENVVENVVRENVVPWELGARFNELSEHYTHADIGHRIGRTGSYVSRHAMLAKQLHPKTITKLNRLATKIPMTALLTLCITNEDGEPQEKPQLERLEQILGERKSKGSRKRAPKSDTAKTLRRLRHLRDEMVIPGHARPYVEAITAYLTGQSRRPVWPEEL